MMEAARTSETSVDNHLHMMEAARTSETSDDNYFTPDDGGSTHL
jgi:hypothetical protein